MKQIYENIKKMQIKSTKYQIKKKNKGVLFAKNLKKKIKTRN